MGLEGGGGVGGCRVGGGKGCEGKVKWGWREGVGLEGGGGVGGYRVGGGTGAYN